MFGRLVADLSRQLDRLAGLCLAAVMVLVVTNVLMRAVLHRPISGTYDLVGILTGLAIGLALANCAVQNGHIAVDLVAGRLAPSLQALLDTLIHGVSCGMWLLVAIDLSRYANTMRVKGLVSSTLQVPLAPVAYLLAAGLLALSLALAWRTAESARAWLGSMALAQGLGQAEPEVQ
jgi:TRAP-type C4-dicarboxylate transport system permease small subunit